MMNSSYSMPRQQHHFAGKLVEMDAGCTLGLNQLSLRLVDDDGASHIVYMAFGRGADAQARMDAQCALLHIGQRYAVAANFGRIGDQHTYWIGAVRIKLDQRRTHHPIPCANNATAKATP